MHMTYPINNLPRALPLCLGVQSEYGARPVSIDVSAWVERWPDIVVSVQPVRPGEDASYLAVDVTRKGNIVTWTPNAYDTDIPGTGYVEVVGLADGVKIIRTGASTTIAPTRTSISKEPGEPIAAWTDTVIKAGEQAKMDADRAQTAADQAVEHADAAKSAETVAKEQATLAEAARADAEKNLESTKMYARDAVIARGDAQIFKNQAQKAQTAAEASASLAEEHATAAGASANLASQKAAEAREYSMGASAYKSQAESSAAHASTYRKAAETAAAAAEENAEASKLHRQAAEEAAKFAQGAAEKGWMYVEGRDDGYLYLVTSDNAPDELTLKDDGQGRLVAVYG